MTTLEKKIDIALRYISNEDATDRAILREEARKALREVIDSPETPKSTDEVLADVLKECGIPFRKAGYDALVVGIKLVLSDRSYLDRNVTKRLYPDIAKAVGTTPYRVERSIRYAVELAFERNDIDKMYNIFGNTIALDKGKLTNSEFIDYCAREVESRMK